MRYCLLLATLIAHVLFAGHASAEKRVALVIGNRPT